MMKTEEGSHFTLGNPETGKVKILEIKDSGVEPKYHKPFAEWEAEAVRGEGCTYPKMALVEYDGNVPHWSYCKVWATWDKDSKKWYPVRLGLGAYGDSTVWKREVSQIRKAHIINRGRINKAVHGFWNIGTNGRGYPICGSGITNGSYYRSPKLTMVTHGPITCKKCLAKLESPQGKD